MDTSNGLQVILLAQATYPGISGFIPGSRGSLMLDVVFVAMFVIVPLLAASIYLVKYRRQYSLHKSLQLTMATVLLVAVLLFELDIRLNGWEERSSPSPYFDPANKWGCPAGISLIVHLSFAVPTLVLWIVVVVQALRKFSRPPQPGPHSRWHARWAMIAAVGMLLTAVTGWLFYWLAFVAR
jgi:putative membrane protein